MGDERRDFRVTDKRLRADDGPEVHAEGAAGETQPAAAPTEDADAGRVAELERELAQARALADERYDQMLRLKADLENARRRMLKEQTDAVERASQRVVEKLLPVLDDFERAISAARASAGDASTGLLSGVELVHRQIVDVLRAEGLERVEADGAPFDPEHHEATASTPGPVDEPTVLEVVRAGYRLKGRTIRPALVHVQTPSEADTADGIADEEDGG